MIYSCRKISNLTYRLKKLNHKQRNIQRKKKNDKNNNVTELSGLDQLFNPDQRRLLTGKVRQIQKWSKETIAQGIRLRYACGKGYNELIKMGYPLPSVRTLCEHVQGFEFLPGITILISLQTINSYLLFS